MAKGQGLTLKGRNKCNKVLNLKVLIKRAAAITVAAFFVFNGIAVPNSFAAQVSVSQEGWQQYTPVVLYDSNSAENTTPQPRIISSDVVTFNPNPLSLDFQLGGNPPPFTQPLEEELVGGSGGGVMDSPENDLEITDSSEAEAFSLNLLMTPPDAEHGGVDVNIIEWNPNTLFSGVTEVQVSRRTLGQDEWELIATISDLLQWRYIDTTIDAAQHYEYQVQQLLHYEYEAWDDELHDVEFSHHINYSVPEGITAENVLVLVNTTEGGLGYVTINSEASEEVVISEDQLMDYLGYQQVNHVWRDANGNDAWRDSDGNGVFVLTDWYVAKEGDGSIEVPLGLYYAIRRNVPKENIVFINNISTEERPCADLTGDAQSDCATDLAADFQGMITQIHDHMVAHNLTDQIASILSAYHFPIALGGHATGYSQSGDRSWEYGVSAALWESFGKSADEIRGNYDSGHFFSHRNGNAGFLATRIDAGTVEIARRMIDDAIWAEENYSFGGLGASDLNAYVDWGGKYKHFADSFIRTQNTFASSGLLGARGEGWELQPSLGAMLAVDRNGDGIPDHDEDQNGMLDNTLLYMGWYNFHETYADVFDYARGAISWDLNSSSADTLRDVGLCSDGICEGGGWQPGGSWASYAIDRGAAVSLGAIFEPYLSGHTQPQLFAYYLMNGYTFAEASYFSTAGLGAMTFNGDPLYNPFTGRMNTLTGPQDRTRIVDVEVNGQRVERHILGDGPYAFGNSFQYFRDYDSSGRLVREQTPGGYLIEYLEDGRMVAYAAGTQLRTESRSIESDYQRDMNGNLVTGHVSVPNHQYNRIWVYDTQGSLTLQGNIPRAAGDWVRDDILAMDDGTIRFFRHYEDSSRMDVFNADGFLLELDDETAEVSSYDFVTPRYFRDGSTQRWTTTYDIENGHAFYETRTKEDESRSILSQLELASGDVVEISYENNSFEIEAVRYFDAEGNLVSEADYLDGAYQIRDVASDSIVGQAIFENWMDFIEILSNAAGHHQQIEQIPAQIEYFLSVRQGISAAGIESLGIYHVPGLLERTPEANIFYFRDQLGRVYEASSGHITAYDFNVRAEFDSDAMRVTAEQLSDPAWENLERQRSRFIYSEEGQLLGFLEMVLLDYSHSIYFHDPVTNLDHAFAEYNVAEGKWQVHIADPAYGAFPLENALEVMSEIGYGNSDQMELLIDPSSVAVADIPASLDQEIYHFEYSLDSGATAVSHDFQLQEGVNSGLTVEGITADGTPYSITLPDIVFDAPVGNIPAVTPPLQGELFIFGGEGLVSYRTELRGDSSGYVISIEITGRETVEFETTEDPTAGIVQTLVDLRKTFTTTDGTVVVISSVLGPVRSGFYTVEKQIDIEGHGRVNAREAVSVTVEGVVNLNRSITTLDGVELQFENRFMNESGNIIGLMFSRMTDPGHLRIRNMGNAETLKVSLFESPGSIGDPLAMMTLSDFSIFYGDDDEMIGLTGTNANGDAVAGMIGALVGQLQVDSINIGSATVSEEETSAIPEAPVTLETLETPEAAATPETPETPEAPVTLETLETPEAAATPETPETPEAPVTPETPATPEAPVTPETPATPEAPVTPETPATPEAPVTPETPATPKAPVTPETPAVPETPATSETSEIVTPPYEAVLEPMSSVPLIDARQDADSFFAHSLGSYIRDDNGTLHMTFPVSGKPYDDSQDPEWKVGSEYPMDRIVHVSSTDNGLTWSAPRTLIEAYTYPNGQQNITQSPCTHSIVHYNDYYYMYFESFIPDTMTIGIFVARATEIGGNYEIYVGDEQWSLVAEAEVWEPVLVPGLLRIPEGEQIATQFLHTSSTQDMGNDYWGLGIPTVRVKNSQIVLSFIDTTRDYLNLENWGNVYTNPNEQLPFRFEITTTNPAHFDLLRETKVNGQGDAWFSGAQAVYVPELQQHLMFEARVIDGDRKICVSYSDDGEQWSDYQVIADYPDIDLISTAYGNDNRNYFIRVLVDEEGAASLDDLRLLLTGDYLFDVQLEPYPGFDDIYEYSLTLQSATQDSELSSSELNSDGVGDAYDGAGGGGQANMWDTTGDGQINMWDANLDGSADIYDTTGDGQANIWDRDHNGIVDAFDTTGDGRANMRDEDEDGTVESFDLDGDGTPDYWTV